MWLRGTQSYFAPSFSVAERDYRLSPCVLNGTAPHLLTASGSERVKTHVADDEPHSHPSV
ncbi:MAG: hypothetical protein DI630_37215 [Gordonia sp. (in: high G+C Gram-positive bacteria)]|nr:MAG: hypothetical protein DI630_37215 [Gordonia sp. (in: high G+C Gram-positive bacteria)]